MRSATVTVNCDVCGEVSSHACTDADNCEEPQGWWALVAYAPEADGPLRFDVCNGCVVGGSVNIVQLVEARLAAPVQPRRATLSLLDGAADDTELEQARAAAQAEKQRKEAEMREGMVVVGPVMHRDDRPTPPSWTIDKFVPLVVHDPSARQTWLASLKNDAHVHCTDNGTHCGPLGVIVAHDDDPTGTFFVQFAADAMRALPPGLEETPPTVFEFQRMTGAYVKRDGIGPAHFPQLQPIGRVSQAPLPVSPLSLLSELLPLSADEERAVDDMILANDESESDTSEHTDEGESAEQEGDA